MTVMASQGFGVRPAPPVARRFFGTSSTGERSYDVARDGKFLGLLATGSPSTASSRPELRVVLNWFDELKARVR